MCLYALFIPPLRTQVFSTGFTQQQRKYISQQFAIILTSVICLRHTAFSVFFGLIYGCFLSFTGFCIADRMLSKLWGIYGFTVKV